MRYSPGKRIRQSTRLLLILCMIILLSACFERLIYNNLNTTIGNRIADYVTLSSNQETLLDQRLKSVLAWHSMQELPLYQTKLQSLARINADNINQTLVENQIKQLRQYQQNLLNRLATELLIVSQTLTSEQKQQILSSIKKTQQKIDKKQLSKSQAELQEDVYERIVEVSEWFIGSVNRGQQQLIRQATKRLTPPALGWQEHNERVYLKWQKLFQLTPTTPEYKSQFMSLFLNSNRLYGNALSQKVNDDLSLISALITDIAHLMSHKQWQHFHEHIEQWQKIIHNLRR